MKIKIKKISDKKYTTFLVVSKLSNKFEYILASFDNKQDAKKYIKMEA